MLFDDMIQLILNRGEYIIYITLLHIHSFNHIVTQLLMKYMFGNKLFIFNNHFLYYNSIMTMANIQDIHFNDITLSFQYNVRIKDINHRQQSL